MLAGTISTPTGRSLPAPELRYTTIPRAARNAGKNRCVNSTGAK